MPFPLAHPAATLPFRRWCPRYFDFSALVVGSLVPDLASSIDHLEYFSHTILGSFVFCLPLGLLTLWILRQVRAPLIATLPNPHRAVLLSFRAVAPNSLIQIMASLLLGSWLHIAWDLFTHDHSWLVRYSVLSSVTIEGVRLNHLVWLLSSIIGVAILFVEYLSLVRKKKRHLRGPSRPDRRAWAFWLGILLLPFVGAVPLALHDPTYYHGAFLPFLAVYYFSCCYVTLGVIGFLVKYLHMQGASGVNKFYEDGCQGKRSVSTGE